MRNYLYISDAKVDMYLPQIEAVEKKKFATRFGFDLKVLQGSLETEWVSLENRVRRLQVVEEEILRTKPVGTLEATQSWIEGTADVAAAPFPDNRNLTFFFSSSDGHFLGLGGSTHHVVGNARPETAVASTSHLHRLLDTLEAISTNYSFVVEKSDEALLHHVHVSVKQFGGISSWTRIMDQVSTDFDRWPRQTVAFLARRLTSDEYGSNGLRYTLASPLYVALEDVGE
jgi:hypothetical protein